MQYTYQPLPGPRSIRLLSFSPGTRSSDLICVQLHIVDLDSESRPKYWGLSYTWDNPLPSYSPIPLRLPNTRSCAMGNPSWSDLISMIFLKDSGVADTTKLICINQND